jgi:hypothetical protein
VARGGERVGDGLGEVEDEKVGAGATVIVGPWRWRDERQRGVGAVACSMPPVALGVEGSLAARPRVQAPQLAGGRQRLCRRGL